MGRRAGRWLLGLAVFVAVAAAAFWAGRVTIQPEASVPAVPKESTEVTVVEQELGRVITLTTTVTRPSMPLARNALSGVVTSVSAQDASAYDSGDVLYTVGDTPVVLVEGEVPFWRDLAEGSRGDDVRQVEQMLAQQGADLDPDTVWDAATTSAVQEWQAGLGASETGELPLGSVLAAKDPPVAVSLDRALARPGETLAGGEVVVSVADGDPTFVMEVTQDQASLVPLGTTVSIQSEDSEWLGVITEATTTEEGLTALTVDALDGGLVCGTECGTVPATGETYLLTEVAIVAPVTAPVVPVAALTTEVDGTTTVQVSADGNLESRPVEVLAVADGLAAVEGVSVGERVRVFGEQGTAPPVPADDTTPPRTDDTTPLVRDDDATTSEGR